MTFRRLAQKLLDNGDPDAIATLQVRWDRRVTKTDNWQWFCARWWATHAVVYLHFKARGLNLVAETSAEGMEKWMARYYGPDPRTKPYQKPSDLN